MDKPFFSIIVPIYNTPSEYLKQCINSLCSQNFENIEIILVDDGSNESCAAMCDQYASMDSRIRVIHQTNQGVSAARNHGIEQAVSDWVMFVDADDWIRQDACMRLSEVLNKVECDILLFGIVKEYPTKQEKLKYGFEPGKLYKTDDVSVKEQLYMRAMGSPNTKDGKYCVVYYSPDKVYRRDFLIQNSLHFPVGIPKSEDKLFILSCFEKMKAMYFMGDALYHYRINEVSVCNRYSEKTDTDRIALCSILREVAARMDRELGVLKNDTQYHVITHEFYRFTFGIISDVLLLKYYHPDHPDRGITRYRQAKRFLQQKPFCEAIANCSYKELPNNAKIKKFLLSCGMIGMFCYFKQAMKNIQGKNAMKAD